MTFTISIGHWGGIYCCSGRLCLGWIAFTFLPIDLDIILLSALEELERE
jgi:hypothetical protein